jgi:hypothetical protein
MATIRVEHASSIPRPPGQVFRVASDPLRQVDWDVGTCRGVEPLTPGPTRKGSRYRVHLGGEVFEAEVVEFVRDARFATLATTRDGVRRSTIAVAAAPGGTTLTQVDELVPSGLAALLGPVTRRRLVRRQREVAERLKRYVFAGGGQSEGLM